MKTYVVNLDGSDDRLRSISDLLDNLSIPFERVSAVDGRKLDLSTVADYDDGRARRYMGRSLVGGEIGCYYSHLKVARLFLESGAPHALVFEDDARPVCDIKQLLEQALPDLDKQDPDWLLLNIGNNKLKICTPLQDYTVGDTRRTLMAAHYFPMTTSAIVWSRRGAQTFVDNHTKIFAPVDNFFRYWLTRAGHGYSIWPSPADTIDTTSQITNTDGTERRNHARTWFYKIAKLKRLLEDKLIVRARKHRFKWPKPQPIQLSLPDGSSASS